MSTSEVIKNLTEMMMATDNEKDFVTLSEALKLIAKKEQHKVAVPCNIGDKLYSVIGEKVNTYVITGFRIDKEKIYCKTKHNQIKLGACKARFSLKNYEKTQGGKK